jgi:hypothetical protein
MYLSIQIYTLRPNSRFSINDPLPMDQIVDLVIGCVCSLRPGFGYSPIENVNVDSPKDSA